MTALAASYPSRKVSRSRAARLLSAPLALAFKVQPQGGLTNWCWAAVSSSISVFFPSPPGPPARSMCEVATETLSPFRPVNCCNSPDPCDIPWNLQEPLRRVGHLHAYAKGWLSPEAVAAEILAGNPVPIAIQWQNRGFHFLAIYGMQTVDDQTTMIWVTDPIYKEGSISHQSLIQGGYHSAGGHWAWSFTVKAA